MDMTLEGGSVTTAKQTENKVPTDDDDDEDAGARELLQSLQEGLCRLELQDLPTSDKSRALVMASRRGWEYCIDQLLEAGANPNAEDDYGYTPLMFLAVQGLVDSVKKMLGTMRCIINKRTLSQQTALHFAAKKGQSQCVLILIERGAVVNVADNWGETPLILAVNSGSIETVKALLNAGAHIDMADLSGNDAFMHAARQGQLNILNLFIARGGIDPNKAYKSSALHEAARYGHQHCCKALLRAGAHMHMRDIHGNLAIELATQTDQADVVSCFLDHNAHKDEIDSSLAAAAFWGATNCMNVLLEHGASPNNAFNKHRISAFFLAIAQNNVAMVVGLIRNNCAVNKPIHKLYLYNTDMQELCTSVPCDNVRPLHVACLRGYGKLVRVLIAAGASLEPVNMLLSTGMLSSYIDGDLMAWLSSQCKHGLQPQPLTIQCRRAIRGSSCSSISSSKRRSSPPALTTLRQVHTLPLPPRLLDFIAFKDLDQFI